MKKQLDLNKKSMSALYRELEEERSASAVAASQAMALINRLHEEKAAMHMEALQYLRMMEEQADHDHEAIQNLHDLLTEREKELLDLDSELENCWRLIQDAPFNGRKLDATDTTYGRNVAIDVLNGSDFVGSTMSGFKDKKVYILESLSRLEEKLHIFTHKLASDDATSSQKGLLGDHTRADGQHMEKSQVDKGEKEKLVEGFLGYIIYSTQEAVVLPPFVAFAVRMNPGIWEYVKFHSEELSVEGITPSEYLKFEETLYDEKWAKDDNSLVVDFGALVLSTPHLTILDCRKGLQFVSKFLSSQPSDKPEEVFVSGLPRYTLYLKFEHRFQEWGLEKGWGDTAERCKETLDCLSEVLQASDPINREKFFSRVLSIFNIVVFSIHGYLGQEEVPDAKSTKCNVELEPGRTTKQSNILHMPLKTEDGKDLCQWVSQFDIYPDLERYAQDAATKILDVLEGKPDLTIGNYTDGDLVASIMFGKLGVTQGTIAHLDLCCLRVLLQQKHGGDYFQVRRGMEALLVPWDPGGNGDYSFVSAWGQASSQGGRNVTDRPSCGFSRGPTAQEARGEGIQLVYKGASENDEKGDQRLFSLATLSSSSRSCLPPNQNSISDSQSTSSSS